MSESPEQYRERHREKYAVLLGRVVGAYRKPESVRTENAGLLARIVAECESERIKATSGFLHDELRPIAPGDPLIASTDALLGRVEDIARGIAEGTSICFESVEEYMASLKVTT